MIIDPDAAAFRRFEEIPDLLHHHMLEVGGDHTEADLAGWVDRTMAEAEGASPPADSEQSRALVRAALQKDPRFVKAFRRWRLGPGGAR